MKNWKLTSFTSNKPIVQFDPGVKEIAINPDKKTRNNPEKFDVDYKKKEVYLIKEDVETIGVYSSVISAKAFLKARIEDETNRFNDIEKKKKSLDNCKIIENVKVGDKTFTIECWKVEKK